MFSAWRLVSDRPDLGFLNLNCFPLLPSLSRSQFTTLANMFKPSPTMMARLRFTTKQVNGGYYKGTRTGSMGQFDKKGNYVIDWKKVRTYVVPDDLEEFDVCATRLMPFLNHY